MPSFWRPLTSDTCVADGSAHLKANRFLVAARSRLMPLIVARMCIWRSVMSNVALSAAAAVLLLSSAVAEAKIECRDGFQIVNSQQISTPAMTAWWAALRASTA